MAFATRFGKPLGFGLLLAAAILGGCATERPYVPESQRAVHSEYAVVTAAHPLAAEAGRDMLERGGSAVDAAIAAQLVLGLVEPQSSGLGGGAFLLHSTGEGGDVTAYDGRETAPGAATPGLFLREGGEPMNFWDAVKGGRSVGVPGLLRMLELAHRDHGALPWATLFEPAIAAARNGFEISPRLHESIAATRDLKEFDATRAYFHGADGRPLPVGHTLINHAYADTLETVARDGADAFYSGPIAKDIVDAVRTVETNPGLLSAEDLAAYEAKRRDPLCRPYRDTTVCGMPPPTSGGLAVLQILGILNTFDLDPAQSATAEHMHLLAEASRLAFADRDHFLADADFVDVPVDELLDPEYLAGRAGLISRDRSMGPAQPGLPADGTETAMAQPRGPSTTHLSIVDPDGNAVSMTSSIEQAFGSRVMVRGFLLNNQLTDFSFLPERDGRPIANRVEAGKRPRSSMSPSLVLDGNGELLLAVGSPGGPRIIGYVAQRIHAVVDQGMDVARAIAEPNVVNRNGPTEVERDRAPRGLVEALRQRGHEVELVEMTSGIHAVSRDRDGRLHGAADPRREGVALEAEPR